MKDRVYTLLDLAEEFGKDKQFIRRRIMKLNLRAINKDTREHLNEPLKYSHCVYLELAKQLGLSNSNTPDMHETCDDTQKYADDLSKDKLIEVLERELKHSKDKLKKSEEEKENLMRLLDQQQRLSLQANQKIEILEYKKQEIIENKEEKQKKKRKWYDIFNKNK